YTKSGRAVRFLETPVMFTLPSSVCVYETANTDSGIAALTRSKTQVPGITPESYFSSTFSALARRALACSSLLFVLFIDEYLIISSWTLIVSAVTQYLL